MPDARRLLRFDDVVGSILTTANADLDVDVNDAQILAVIAALTGAANGDLTVVVRPYFMDSTPTLCPLAITPVRSTGPTLVSGSVYYVAEFDVGSLSKVQVRCTNNNAGTQTLSHRSIGLS